MRSKRLSSLFLILLLASSVIILGNSQTTFALTPVADLTGQWSGFAQFTIPGGYCEYSGKVNAYLEQDGNNIVGEFSWVATSSKSVDPEIYECSYQGQSYSDNVQGTIDGSRISLTAAEAKFDGWYASAGIKLDIIFDDSTIGITQLSPTNFTPPPFEPKDDSEEKKKKASDEAKKKKVAEEAKKKAAEEEKKKKAADDAAKKKAEEAKKKSVDNQKKNNAVSDEKKTKGVKTEKKKTGESGNQQNKIDTIPWTQASTGVDESKSSILDKTKATGYLAIDLVLKTIGIPEDRSNAYALFGRYFISDGKTPYELTEIPADWQDWIVKQLKNKKDGKQHPLSPYNDGPADLRETLGGFNVEIIKNSDGTRTYKISDTYNFEFTPEEIKKKTQHGRVVEWMGPTTIRYMNNYLATLGEYDYPDGKTKEKFEIKKLAKGNTLILPQKWLLENGLPFPVKGEFTR